MSIEDILKVLVDSRQPGAESRPASGSDPMTDLIRRLLGGGQQAPADGQPAQPAPTSGGGGLGDFMNLLERLLGSGRSAQNPSAAPSTTANDPLMALLRPFVDKLAQKVNISPEIAMLVVTFVIHKLLAHHPTSGRDSTQFNLDDMLQQMASGQISQQTLQSSGMVDELARTTGLDQETAARSLDATLGLLGGSVRGSAGSAGGAKRSKRKQ